MHSLKPVTFTKLSGSVIDVSLQPEKARDPTRVTRSGITSEPVIPKQPENADEPTLVKDSGSSSDVIFSQFSKALMPINVNVSGITRVDKLQQFLKASRSILMN